MGKVKVSIIRAIFCTQTIAGIHLHRSLLVGRSHGSDLFSPFQKIVSTSCEGSMHRYI